MNQPPPGRAHEPIGASTLVEETREYFEKAWQEDCRPDLEQYLPINAALRRAVLVELVRIDLEHRLKAGEAAHVEEYLEKYPDLAGDREVVLSLIEAEYRQRRWQGQELPSAEYARRFPGFFDELISRYPLVTTVDEKAGLSGAPAVELREQPWGDFSGVDAALAQPGVPGYEIHGVLGRGGMGIVYAARQTRLKRLVALKMILAGPHAGTEELTRFYREAQAAARLRHPNIVQIYEVGEHAGSPYLVLEHVEGTSLHKRFAGQAPQPDEAASLVETLARAVHYAHQQGIIHRDLKPGNVLVGADGVPKLCDFGLAKVLGSDTLQTQTGDLLGTPSYMAPEQALGRTRDVGPATDVYGLGAILYELLTGRPPFCAPTRQETLEQVRACRVLAPSKLRPGVPRDLEGICLTCLRKEPARRYASARELAEDLRQYLGAEPTASPDLAWRKRRPRQAKRWVFLALGVVLGGVLVLFLLALPLLNRHAPKGQVEEMPPAERLAAATEAGQHALADGNYRLALRELNVALELRDRHPGLLAPADDRRLAQLQRQGDLLARLLNRSLLEIVQEAALVRDPGEWQARFDDDYRGRAVIFDDEVRRDGDGRPALGTYAVVVNKETVRLGLEDLKLLQALPLALPARMLFGARLAGCAREKGGGWVIRFEPESAVLLTDAGAAASCCPAPLGRELEEVLRRQEGWLHDLAGQRAARE
jgi:hypothetical protein